MLPCSFSASCLFFNLSAFNSRLSWSLDFAPLGPRTGCWVKACAEGLWPGSGWTINSNKLCKSTEYRPATKGNRPVRRACHSSPFLGRGSPLAIWKWKQGGGGGGNVRTSRLKKEIVPISYLVYGQTERENIRLGQKRIIVAHYFGWQVAAIPFLDHWMDRGSHVTHISNLVSDRTVIFIELVETVVTVVVDGKIVARFTADEDVRRLDIHMGQLFWMDIMQTFGNLQGISPNKNQLVTKITAIYPISKSDVLDIPAIVSSWAAARWRKHYSVCCSGSVLPAYQSCRTRSEWSCGRFQPTQKNIWQREGADPGLHEPTLHLRPTVYVEKALITYLVTNRYKKNMQLTHLLNQQQAAYSSWLHMYIHPAY